MAHHTDLIAVLDLDTREQARSAMEAIGDCSWVKIGFQLFTRCGPPVVEDALTMGKQVFLDLKFHDIPNTVAKAARAGAELGASFMTVHAAGGRQMIAAAREAVEGTPARLLAVTILTSLSDEDLRSEVGLHETAAEAVPRLAAMAIDAGAHGIVCSPREVEAVRAVIGPEPAIVTPGVRPAWASKDDQKRVMTPGEAARAGANYIVVGRPIFAHESPPEAVRLMQEELDG